MSKLKSRLMWAALMAMPGLVQAGTPEREANDPVASAQTVEITATGAEIDGVIGSLTGSAVVDLDFFVFEGQAGDVVTLDIDGGMKPKGSTEKNVDTILAIFGPAPDYAILRQNDDASLDPGSTGIKDARIEKFVLPESRQYVVGVSSAPRTFVKGAKASSATIGTNANGSYKLLITGVTVSVLQISLDIKPGSDGGDAPINPKARGKIPVALLGSKDFSVDDVDMASLTFGHSGNEASLSKCGSPSNVNGDAFPDMVCHFENQAAAWTGTEDEAMLKGKLESGRRFEGRGWLKVVPVKAED